MLQTLSFIHFNTLKILQVSSKEMSVNEGKGPVSPAVLRAKHHDKK